MIRDIPKCERPRERLIAYGVEALSNEELLAIILKSGTRNKSVKSLASEVLNNAVEIDRLKDCGINLLTSINGIGETKACEVLASIELGKRIYLIGQKNKYKIKPSTDVYNLLKYDLSLKPQEYFYCLYLNNKNEVLERKLLFMGTVNKSLVHPREVFKYAYLSSASGIICIHNHPSGDVNPSRDDIILTEKLVEIGRIQAIPIIDHIIVGDDSYYSMAESLDLFGGRVWKRRIIYID